MQNELLLEIGSEEIPAGFIGPALKNMQKTMAEKLDGLELQYESIRTAATPRRLAICVNGLISKQPDREEEFLGPAKKAAFDQDSKPTKAAIGFARSKGAGVEDLQVVNTPKGKYVMLARQRMGMKTESLLPELLKDLTVGLPFAKSMRWGEGNTSFARPIHWLLALYGGQIIDFQVGDIKSGATTKGHRFMAPGFIEVKDFAQYVDVLRQNNVLVDIAERRQAVIAEIRKAASERSGAEGARILEDEELIDTVTNLVENPHGVCGKFEARFLELPDDVLITAMREHQKYFCVTDAQGRLLAKRVTSVFCGPGLKMHCSSLTMTGAGNLRTGLMICQGSSFKRNWAPCLRRPKGLRSWLVPWRRSWFLNFQPRPSVLRLLLKLICLLLW
jgi:glycyl-tRNA synthetase beta chain